MNGIDEQINSWVSMIGSREKLEEYRKKAVFGTFQIFFLKKFCSSKKRFYNGHVLESQTNGKQVRRKTNKKIDSKKTDLRNRQTKPPRARNKKPFLWETYF